MRLLTPNLYVSSIYDIDIEHLQLMGVRAIVTDLDNTLVGWNEPAATEPLLLWLADVKDRGMGVCIVSNNQSGRVESFARPLALPFISAARKPRRRAFNQALATLGCAPQEAAMIGDQLFTDIAGGNRSGLYTILVMPISNLEWIGTRVVRKFERVMMAYLRSRGLLTREGR